MRLLTEYVARPLAFIAFVALSACGGPRPVVPAVGAAGAQCDTLGSPAEQVSGQGLKAGKPDRLPQTLGRLLEQPARPTQTQWRALPPGADAELVRTALDAEAEAAVRVRALHALGVRAPDGARDPLVALLDRADAGVPVRAAAAQALVVGYLSERDAPVQDTLERALGAPDAAVRLAVVRALGATDRAAARRLLESRAEAEEDPRVRAALQQALEHQPKSE